MLRELAELIKKYEAAIDTGDRKMALHWKLLIEDERDRRGMK